MRAAAFLWIFLLALPAIAANERLRVRLTDDAGTLDWNYGEVNHEIAHQLMAGLYGADRKGQAYPRLAKSMEVNKSQTRFIFRLREGLRWSDGSALCAEDFVRSWDRLRSHSFASPYAHYASVFASYRALDCTTLEVKTARQAPELTALLTHHVFFPLHKSGDVSGAFVNGPYQVKRWEKDQRFLIERNPHYYGPPAPLSEIEFLFLPEDNTALAFFEKKAVDVVFQVPALVRPAYGNGVVYFPQHTNYFLGLTGKSAALKHRELRIALRAALKLEELPRILGRELQPLEGRFLPAAAAQGSKVFVPVRLSLKEWKAARAQAAKAKDLRLRIYNKGTYKLLAEWLQSQWQQRLGVKIPVDVAEEKVYWKEIPVQPAAIFLSGITAPFPHALAFLQEFASNSSANWTAFRSPAFDALLTQRKFRAAEELLMQEAFVIPLYERGQALLIAPRWQGKVWLNPLGQLAFGGDPAAAAGSSAF